MHSGRACGFATAFLIALAAPVATAPAAADLPAILISRQLAEQAHLHAGDTVTLAIDAAGSGPRRFRIDGTYEPMCIGTTTSARMVRFTEPLGRDYGVRAICGKGGLPDEAIEPMRRYGMVYFAIVGGAAALETTQIEEIEEVAWEELMPECLWKFRVKDFGPLWVGIDSHGNSMFHDVQEQATKKLEELYDRL